MSTEFSKIISGASQAKAQARKGRKTASGQTKGKIRQIPDYEDIANWRGIESALDAIKFDHASKPGADVPHRLAIDMTEGASPHEIIGQRNQSLFYAGSMSEAITSALSNMRPQLAKMVEKESGAKSVSTETLVQYQSQAQKIIAHYLELFELRDQDDINWVNFAEWFLARQDLKYSTWKVYRSALRDHLERTPSDDAAVALSLIHSTEGLTREDEDGLDSYRTKYIDSNDFDRILYHCSRYPSETNYQLSTYLRANVRIGLRPVEYLTSEIRAISDQNAPNGRQVWLFVCNAKYSRGRANGPIRLMDLSAMDDYAISAIRDCIGVVKLQNEMTGYDLWLRNLNRSFQRISDSPRSVVTTRYNAYSARHQAIANWKSMYDPITVAAMAGHAMPSTASQHYGSAKHAWPRERLDNMIARPSLADVERVQARVLAARRIKAMAGIGGQVPDMSPDDMAPTM